MSEDQDDDLLIAVAAYLAVDGSCGLYNARAMQTARDRLTSMVGRELIATAQSRFYERMARGEHD